MTRAGEKDEKSGKAGGSGRERRLAAALRENLRRRKAQARGRERGPDSEPAPDHSYAGGNPGPKSQS
jgi:hypothetical protein